MRSLTAALAVVLLSACIPQSATGQYQWPGDGATNTPNPTLDTDLAVLEGEVPPAVWQSKTAQVNATDVAGSSYTVQSGDTLRAIGSATGAGSEAIALANGLAPPFTIYPGQRLSIPAGRYHRVSEGESGIGIAQAYGVPWREIIALNALEDPYILRNGQRLRLPDAVRTGPSLEERAAAFRIDIDDVVTGGQPALALDGAAQTGKAALPVASTAALASPKSFTGAFLWPVDGTVLARFGNQGGGRINQGVDIGAARGTPVRASAAGVVTFSGDSIQVFGGLILIDHGAGWVTAYGHVDRLDVVRGQSVKAGQVIGISGNSGLADQPQLHFEIRKNRLPVDPLLQLPKRI